MSRIPAVLATAAFCLTACGTSSSSTPAAADVGARSAVEQIPATTRTAVLDYTGPLPNTGQPARAAEHRTLTGADLHEIVNTLNALPALPPGTYSCSSDDGEQAVITTAQLQFTIELSGCRHVDVVANGVTQPVLEASLTGSLGEAIDKALGVAPIPSRGPT